MDNLPAIIIGTVLVGVLIVSGVLAYTGRYKGWLMLKSFLPGWPGLAGLYLGVGIGLVVVLPSVMDALPPLLVLLAGALAFGSLLIGIVGMFWLPRFLLPGWVREQQDQMRRGEDAFSTAMQPGGALYGRLGVRPEDRRHDPALDPPRPDRPGSAGPDDAGHPGVHGGDAR